MNWIRELKRRWHIALLAGLQNWCRVAASKVDSPLVTYPFLIFVELELPQIYERDGYKAAKQAVLNWRPVNPFEKLAEEFKLKYKIIRGWYYEGTGYFDNRLDKLGIPPDKTYMDLVTAIADAAIIAATGEKDMSVIDNIGKVVWNSEEGYRN